MVLKILVSRLRDIRINNLGRSRASTQAVRPRPAGRLGLPVIGNTVHLTQKSVMGQSARARLDRNHRISPSHLLRDSWGRGPGGPGSRVTIGISQVDLGYEIDSLLSISASVVQNSSFLL